MASQTLVTAAEKMYGSMAGLPEGSVGVGRLLLDPATTALKENIAAQKKITDDLMGKMPMGVDILKVDEKLRPMITEFTTAQKEKYIQAAEVVSKIKNTKDPRYIKAVEEMNQVKTAFENLDTELTGLGDKIKFAFENRDQLAGGLAGTHHEFDMELFANKGIYDKILEHGIGEDGSLSYTSGELSNPNKEKIQTLKAKLEGIEDIEDKTSTDIQFAQSILNEIAELKATGRVGVVKKISDYGGHAVHNTNAVDLIGNLRATIAEAAAGGQKWDENSVEVTVDKIINQLTPDGVRDIMFKYESYINGYIENKFGLEKDTPEFDAKKEELKTEDLTDEFKEHFLGTEDNPGMLRNAYTDNKKRPKGPPPPPPPPTPYSYTTTGGDSFTFKYKPTRKDLQNSLQLVEQTLEGKKVIKDFNSGITYTLNETDGKYYAPQQYEQKFKKGVVVGPDKSKPLPNPGYTGGPTGTFIDEFGGLMQPATVWEPQSAAEIEAARLKKEEEEKKKKEKNTAIEITARSSGKYATKDLVKGQLYKLLNKKGEVRARYKGKLYRWDGEKFSGYVTE